MSHALLSHGFGIRGYQWVGEAFAHQQWQIRIAREPGTLRCSQCNSRGVAKHLGGQLGSGQKHPKGISANLDADKDEPRRLQEDLRQL